jgi:hypothetical protein
MSRGRWWLVAIVVALVAIVALGGTGRGPTPGPVATSSVVPTGSPDVAAAGGGTPAPSTIPSAVPAGSEAPGASAPAFGTSETLAQLLALLPIAPEHRAGYERSLFVHWIDADGDGCDTRHEVLIEEAVLAPAIGPGCALTGGRWVSLYDGLTITDSSKLQIDHVVALAEAWDSGAYAWTPARRRAYANDLGAWFPLIAVSGTTNQSKGDKDPADWLPPAPAAECPYLSAWIATKARWDLAVDPTEHDVLVTDIAACPASRMPYLPVGQAGDGT